MADTSSYSLEERLLASVWTHDRVHSGKSMEDVRHDFTARFGKPCSSSEEDDTLMGT